MAHQSDARVHEFDPTDPHGFHADDEHGHVILPQPLLLGVLIVLLGLTLLTVASAQAEVWIMDTFEITLPWWVNIVVALSIAVVKSILVLAIFMQLWFDSRLNSMVLFTCLICVALFMGFTIGDRATRGYIHTGNAEELTLGGNAFGLSYDELQGPIVSAEGETIITAGLPVAEVARLRAIHTTYGGDEAAFRASKAAKHKRGDDLPTADRTVLRAGLTPGLFDAVAPDAYGKGKQGAGTDAEQTPSGTPGSDGE